jgi:hypothetical protein
MTGNRVYKQTSHASPQPQLPDFRLGGKKVRFSIGEHLSSLSTPITPWHPCHGEGREEGTGRDLNRTSNQNQATPTHPSKLRTLSRDSSDSRKRRGIARTQQFQPTHPQTGVVGSIPCQESHMHAQVISTCFISFKNSSSELELVLRDDY